MNGLCRIGGVLGLTDPTKLFIYPLQSGLMLVTNYLSTITDWKVRIRKNVWVLLNTLSMLKVRELKWMVLELKCMLHWVQLQSLELEQC